MAKVQRISGVRATEAARFGLAAENAMLREALRNIAAGQRPARTRKGIVGMTGPDMQREAQRVLVTIGITRWTS